MTIENIVAFLGLLGIGGLISGYFTLLWQRRSADLAKKQEYKETRYKCIIMLMDGCLDFQRSVGEFQNYGYSIRTVEDLTALLRAEHINAFLFASDDFIRSFGQFIQSPYRRTSRENSSVHQEGPLGREDEAVTFGHTGIAEPDGPANGHQPFSPEAKFNLIGGCLSSLTSSFAQPTTSHEIARSHSRTSTRLRRNCTAD